MSENVLLKTTNQKVAGSSPAERAPESPCKSGFFVVSRGLRDIRVYCEAAGMMPQLRRVTRRYSVPVYSCSGLDSLTAKQELASEVLEAWTYRGRPTVILH